MDNYQAYHQSVLVEFGGNIAKKSIYVLIDLGSTHSYVSLKVVYSCYLGKSNHKKLWLVQLAIETKRKVSKVVMEFPIEMNGILTKENLNVLSLGSYDSLIVMEWLTKHREKLDCYEKVFEFIDEEGGSRLVTGITKKLLVRNI